MIGEAGVRPTPTGRTTGGRIGPVLRETVTRLSAAGIPTAQQDGELLLARLAGTTRLGLHLEPDRILDPGTLARLQAVVGRRAGGEPLQYLLGEEEFQGLRLSVGPGVFIPRPETELLVERAVAVCPEGPAVAVDLCTGSGAVACTLAVRRPALRVFAVELVPEALAWARTNVRRLLLGDRVTVVEGDLWDALAGLPVAGRCDLVVANPPYIAGPALAGLPPEVRDFEPSSALDGGPDGLTVVRRILARAPAYLKVGGRLLLEIGHDQAPTLRTGLAADSRYGVAAFFRDLLGHERVLEVECRGPAGDPPRGGD